VWRWLLVANSEEAVKRLLTALCLILAARPGVADQKTANAALERAINAFNQGRLEEAEKQVDAAARTDGKKTEIANLRGAIFTKKKQYEEADRQFNQALALDPKFYPAKINLAELKMLEGQYGEAAREYEALKIEDPGSELLDFKLVLCALLDGQQTKAAGIVNLMKFPGKTPAYYFARAAIALKRGEKDAAEKYFENVKKYYSEEECRYFVQSLKEFDLTSAAPPPSQEEKTPEAEKAGTGH
jgi:Tfp pilus assembly protein PilF